MTIRATILALLVSVLGLAGCENGKMFGGTSASERAQLAAYAASTPYPMNVRASNDFRAAALVDDAGDVRIVNFSDQPLRDVKVWINGSFVRHVDSIPANGSVKLSQGRFYNSAGQSMSDLNTTPSRIQLQTGDHLYTLQGPVNE